jgi:hypothetical protein
LLERVSDNLLDACIVVNAFCQFPALTTRCTRAAVSVVLAAALASIAPHAVSDGRSGSPVRGCSAVTDGQGETVSGGRGSISTRTQQQCPDARPAPAAKPVQHPRSVSSEPPRPVSEPAPTTSVSIVPGQVNLPADATEAPSALNGHLVRASATVVTGGVLIWFLHSSLWASLLMLGVPIWRHVDLLPVVSNVCDAQRSKPPEVAERHEDIALAGILDAGRERGLQSAGHAPVEG